MVIQTRSEVFAVLMHLDAPNALSAETVKAMMNCREPKIGFSNVTVPDMPSNDRTALPHQKS